MRDQNRTRRRRENRQDELAEVEMFPANAIREIPHYDIISAQTVEKVHQTSLGILERTGIEFRDEVALEQWREAGAEVEGSLVKIPRDLLMEMVAKAPSKYIQHARNPKRSVTVGDGYTAYVPCYGPPYVRTAEGERRYATLEDHANFVKLAYLSPVLNHSGGTICEPNDIAVPHRHLDMLYNHMRFSDKPFMGGITAPERAEDCLEMCKILFGEEFVANHTVMTSLINANSPLVWDESMMSVLRVYAEANQACIITPFIMQGANTPIMTAGAFAQLNAEALAGIAYSQLIRAGAPVIYGASLATISMQTGFPLYGTSETQQLALLVGQMARFYGVPMRTGGMRCSSKAVDANAAYEGLTSLWPAVMAGANYILHSVGAVESGMSACYGKFILDCDQVGVLRNLVKGLEFSEQAFATDTIDEVGPGGHFLGCAQTLSRARSEFFVPESLEQDTYEAWAEAGSSDAYTRALGIAAEKLKSYEAPPLDAGVDEQLREFIARRKSEIPV